MTEYLETTADKFTFRVAVDRFYTQEGVWALRLQPEFPSRVRVGITDFLQQRSGDVAFLSVKATGTRLQAGDELAEMETVKVNLSLHSPVGGTIVEVNKALEPSPEIVNQAPYGEGWLAVIETTSWEQDRARLVDAPAYMAVMKSEVAKEVEAR